MVGRENLDLVTKVRVLVPQPIFTQVAEWSNAAACKAARET